MSVSRHPIVQEYLRDAEANSARHRAELFTKIRDILEKAGIPSDKIDAKAEEVYASKRTEITGRMHVSVNTRGERVIALVEYGKLQPSVSRNIYSKLHRTNAEECFDDNLKESPIYGALNLDSPRGAAPAYCPDLWLKLSSADIQDSTTFTARDSYTVTLPFLAEFEVGRGREALRHEIYTWETVPDYFLNRFWGLQDVDTTTYVEAQVWGGVLITTVESFHIHSNLLDPFLTRLERCAQGDNVKYVKDRLIVFD